MLLGNMLIVSMGFVSSGFKGVAGSALLASWVAFAVAMESVLAVVLSVVAESNTTGVGPVGSFVVSTGVGLCST